MKFPDSLIVSLFGLAIVFVVLIVLSGIVSLQSRIVGAFSKKRTKPEKREAQIPARPVVNEAATEAETSSGELKLIDVDERTAAVIMAIVSHEARMPLSQLQFKYIKAIE
jgi:Na+-transporting methylmalonyl-CoA/oxaloacetate decarboxylase gamma subunit